jgi:hypothetical protein
VIQKSSNSSKDSTSLCAESSRSRICLDLRARFENQGHAQRLSTFRKLQIGLLLSIFGDRNFFLLEVLNGHPHFIEYGYAERNRAPVGPRFLNVRSRRGCGSVNGRSEETK